MKNKIRFLNVLMLCFFIGFTSCDEDDLDDMFGDPVEKFLGTWKCEETGDQDGYFGPFNVQIIRNPENSAEVLIKNFNYQGMNEQARALITSNTITIPRQRICDDTIEIKGSGLYRDGEINMEYSTNTGATLENIVARFFDKKE